MAALPDLQKRVCQKFGADFLQCYELLRVGISRDFDPGQFPINGLRHPPEGDTTGWYIRSSENFSQAADFLPLFMHFICTIAVRRILKYLGLAPGWRFLIAPDYEDVWFDEKLPDVRDRSARG